MAVCHSVHAVGCGEEPAQSQMYSWSLHPCKAIFTSNCQEYVDGPWKRLWSGKNELVKKIKWSTKRQLSSVTTSLLQGWEKENQEGWMKFQWVSGLSSLTFAATEANNHSKLNTTQKYLNISHICYYFFPGCGGIIHSDNGTIKSPHWPQNFPMNSRCTWTIITHESKHLEMNFHSNFQIPDSNGSCQTSYVKVK